MAGGKDGAAEVRAPRSGVATGNRILDALDPPHFAGILAGLEPITLAAGEVLAVTGAPLGWSLFPGPATVISLVAIETNGRTAETVSVGAEGVVGPELAGLPGFGQLQVQIPGYGWRVAAATIDGISATCPVLRDSLAAHGRALLAQALQAAACAALHPVEARAGRWMLMAQDRLQQAELPITQEALADLLGVRRTTITRVIAQLAEKGLIRHRRSKVTIADRLGLEQVACGCHAALMQRLRHLAPTLYPPL